MKTKLVKIPSSIPLEVIQEAVSAHMSEANKYKVNAPETTSEREKTLGTVSFADPINGKIRISKSTSVDGEWNVRRVPKKTTVGFNNPQRADYQAPSQNIKLGCKTFEEALEAARKYLARRTKKLGEGAARALKFTDAEKTKISAHIQKMLLNPEDYVDKHSGFGDPINDAVFDNTSPGINDEDVYTDYQNDAVHEIADQLHTYFRNFKIDFSQI
jgi:hypothetical protein